MSEWWLDVGAGINAEHWAATPCPAHVRRIALDLLAEEVFRVLRPGGELTVLLPHLGGLENERNLQHTEAVLRRTFGDARLDRFEGPFASFWADLYRDRTYRIRCVRADDSRVR